jgi:iron complex outermembrane receptor protein
MNHTFTRRPRAYTASAGALGLVAAAAVTVPPAVAAEQAGASAQLEEIVVTARKRAEDVRLVPESITTFSSAEIAAAQIRSADDFVAMTPNFSIVHAETAGNFQMSIRGITQVSKGDAPVTMVIDGVTLPYASAFTRPLFDVEQIEVLKGPQGSLYGQNAIGGAIIVTTKRPTDATEGSVTASYGNHNSAYVSAAVSGPLVDDRLFFRLAGSAKNDDGDVDYLLYPGRRENPDRNTNVRAELRAQLSERLTADLSVGAGHYKGGALALVPVTLSTGSGIPFVDTATLNQSLVLGKENYDFPESNRQTSTDAALHLVYDFGAATLSSVTAAQRVDERQFQDIDVSRFPFVTVDQVQKIRALSEELRLTSNGEGRARWVIGAFYMTNHRHEDIAIGLNATLASGGSQATADAVYVPFEVNNNDQHLDARALFGQVSYDLRKDLELTLGGRYDSDPRKQQTSGYLLSPQGPVPLGLYQKSTFDEFQPKASLRWQFSPEANVYLTFAKGFRPGGFNSGVSSNVAQAFPAETTQALELGSKSSYFDRRLTLDLAVFSTRYHHQQLGLVQVTQNGTSTNTYDVTKTDIYGAELAIQAKPTPRLQLAYGAGYTHARIKEFGTSLVGSQFSPDAYVGNSTPMVPEYTMNFSGQYTWPLAAGLNGVARVDVETKGRMSWYPDNVVQQGSYSLLNLKLGVSGEHWQVRLYGDNVLDKKYYVLYFDNRFVQAPGGFNFAFLNLRARYGLEATYRW